MKWIKLFCLSSVLFISAVIFGSQPTYASSYTYTPVINSIEAFDFTNVPFTPHFVRFDVQQVSGATFQQRNVDIGVSSNGYPSNPFSTNFTQVICVMNIRDTFNSSFVCPVDSGWVYKIQGVFPANFNSTVTMTLLDTLDPEQEPCPVCPEIPETPYGDILDKIYHAILFVPAVALVLYFFYVMFGWYLGGRS